MVTLPDIYEITVEAFLVLFGLWYYTRSTFLGPSKDQLLPPSSLDLLFTI